MVPHWLGSQCRANENNPQAASSQGTGGQWPRKIVDFSIDGLARTARDRQQGRQGCPPEWHRARADQRGSALRWPQGRDCQPPRAVNRRRFLDDEGSSSGSESARPRPRPRKPNRTDREARRAPPRRRSSRTVASGPPPCPSTSLTSIAPPEAPDSYQPCSRQRTVSRTSGAACALGPRAPAAATV